MSKVIVLDWIVGELIVGHFSRWCSNGWPSLARSRFCSSRHKIHQYDTNWMRQSRIVYRLVTSCCASLWLCNCFFADLNFDPSRRCAGDPNMPGTVFTADKPCDSSVNCRHGGICWRNADNDTALGKDGLHAIRSGVGTVIWLFVSWVHCGNF